VALLSGGLDSLLAIRVLQEQNVRIEAFNFKTIFTCCQNRSAQAARELGVPLTVIREEDDYLDLIRDPRFGYGKGANPCIDCRIYMFRRARIFMEQIGADFVASGEILGQRPKSQKRWDLDVIAYHAGLEELLLRPLSAKLMPITLPERQGVVDRSQLYAFTGRGRKGLVQLAERYGLRTIPHPSTGCALTDPRFSRIVFDLMKRCPDAGRWDFELLKLGRHFRFDNDVKLIVGRRETENEQLESMHALPGARSTAALKPADYTGALVLVVGPLSENALRYAGGLAWRYARLEGRNEARVHVIERDRTWTMPIQPLPAGRAITTLAAAGAE
jgi:hypothetical protein